MSSSVPSQDVYEKLGVFYLGREYDLGAQQPAEDLVLYDSKDLVTHAVCVGMTGSGKTGLCLALLEEAAIDGIPSIIIDPKGDLSNLLLTFPDLRAEDFRPWINEDDARRKGVSPDDFAKQQAELWAKGLASSGQDGARIARLRAAADFSVYTPGSSAGLPVSILKSLDAPPGAAIDDSEILRERISSTATSLLGLLGIEADPIRSREHILLSTLLSRAWASGESLDLGALIQQIQSPPVTRIGVMELESFFPAGDRFQLAMALNNLLASPGFAAWMEGEPLDIQAMLYTPQGKPRVSIFSIAHLSDAERMFFVSMLLNQTLAWVRTQSGTTSLRALLYMDEIAGYFPPTANPPSKTPLLMLMKQARAFGVGVVLATQNPVDLDYKGLSNAGTWFIGRLQTERDKARVLDGLEGACAAASREFDRATIEKTLSSLGNRVFLMNNVHEDAPVIMQTRWVMSYLRGPLQRQQIKQLMEARKRAFPVPPPAPPPPPLVPTFNAPATTSAPAPKNGAASRPALSPDIPQFFVPIRGVRIAGAALAYHPCLLGSAKVYFTDAKLGVNMEHMISELAEFGGGAVSVDWDHAESVEIADTDLEREPADPSAQFNPLPADAGKPKSYDGWKKSFADAVYRTVDLALLRSEEFGEVSKPGESERDFRARLGQLARERRDALAAKLRQKYAAKFQTLNERLRRAQQTREVQAAQARDAKVSTALSFGSAVLGALFGRKAMSAGNVSKAATAARGVSRSAREAGDVTRADETIEAVQKQIADLESQVQAEIAAADSTGRAVTETLETLSLKPKKTNISVRAVVLVWTPHWRDSSGRDTAAWK